MAEKEPKTNEIVPQTGQKPQKRAVLADRQAEMRARVKRQKTGGRRKGSTNQKTRDTRAWAWSMLRGTAADRRLNRILDKASAHMQAKILLAWMRLAYGEPQSYAGPENAEGTTEKLKAAQARVAKFNETAAKTPTFSAWKQENGLAHETPSEQPHEAPRRAKRIVVQ